MTVDEDGGPAAARPAQADIVLVTMPQAPVTIPSPALGLLKAAATAAGLSCHVVHANLLHLDFGGPLLCRLLDFFRPQDGATDWLFAPVAFPDMTAARTVADDNAYLGPLLNQNRIALTFRHDAADLLYKARARTSAFVDWVLDDILARRPRIVGCTSSFQQHVASLALLRRLRERAPDVVTMMGGANCETVMGRTTHAHFGWVDFVVSGEADAFFGDLCRRILSDGARPMAADWPDGVLAPAHRRIGYPVAPGTNAPPRAVTPDMAGVPLPDYDDYFADLADTIFGHAIRPGLPVELSRGCWWGEKSPCVFCGLNGVSRTFRARPTEQALDHLDRLAARHGLRDFEVVDNILAPAYQRDLLPHLKSRDYRLFFETKANLTSDQVRALAEAGVRWIQPGIESLDSRVLKLMNKGVRAWMNVRLLRLCRQHGVRVSWSLLHLLPGEDDAWYADMAAWLPWLAHLQPGGAVPIRFDRYSVYFNEAEARGLRLRPNDLAGHTYPLDDDVLTDLVYFFEADDRAPAFDQGTRPGLSAALTAMRDWGKLWLGGPETWPRLELTPEGQGSAVTDTRPVAVAARHSLSAAETAVLRASLEAPLDADLRSDLSAAGLDPTAIDRAREALIALRLALPLDGRLVGLVLERPVAPLPAIADFPGGHLSVRRA
jgi:ribosomal peptide maturation radical SAM protein 1